MVTPDVIKMSVNRQLAEPAYLMAFLNSHTSRRFAFQAAYGLTRSRMNLPIFRDIPVPLPPLEEQRRIVTMVDTLMRLCDDLEAKLRARDEKAARLAEALVAEVLG